jgi:subtilisin-like proprotein convertase family protein
MKNITLMVLALYSFTLNASITTLSNPNLYFNEVAQACTNGNADASGGIVDSITFQQMETITDTIIGVDINHTWRSDLQIDLTYNGTQVVLAIDHGGNPDNLYAEYDDDAAFRCSDVTQCGNTNDDSSCSNLANRSTCRPDQPLAAFNNMASNLGSFDIRICDDAGGDFGIFFSWSVSVNKRYLERLPVELLNLETK